MLIKVSDIDVSRMKKTPPCQQKMDRAIQYFEENNKFRSVIILANDNLLVDGYTSYLVAKMYGIEEVEFGIENPLGSKVQRTEKEVQRTETKVQRTGCVSRQSMMEKISHDIRKRHGKRRGDKNSRRRYKEILFYKYGRCLDCGKPLQITDRNQIDDYMTLDHIIPRALGGKMELENLQPLCLECNVKKGCRVERDSYILYAKNNNIFKTEEELNQVLSVVF